MYFLSRPATFIFALIIFVSLSFSTIQPSTLSAAAPKTAQPPNGGASAQQLKQCVEIAKQGDVEAAFELAKQTKTTYGAERLFTVSYMNTL